MDKMKHEREMVPGPRLDPNPWPLPFGVFVDDGVICEHCGESVPYCSLLPCRCVREGKDQTG